MMRIVDAQIHLWGSGLPSNMAHRQVTSFTTEEAVGLMDEGGVDAAVIHPPGWDPKKGDRHVLHHAEAVRYARGIKSSRRSRIFECSSSRWRIRAGGCCALRARRF